MDAAVEELTLHALADIHAVLAQARAQGLPFADFVVLVGPPVLLACVARFTPCACPAVAHSVLRKDLLRTLREAAAVPGGRAQFAGIARDLERWVPAEGQFTLLFLHRHGGSVALAVVPDLTGVPPEPRRIPGGGGHVH